MQEVIVKYNGDITALGYKAEILSPNFAILTLPEKDIPLLNHFTEIEYFELSKRLTLSASESADKSCIPEVQSKHGYNLSGEGVIVAVIDSGIDYRHEDFLDAGGKSRIAYIWDQTLEGTPPSGFLYGAEFTNKQINDALLNPDPLSIVPHQDFIGHGTAVAGITAGNGNASGGTETGVAFKSTIIAVKLGERDNARFARTTEIMRALKYVYDRAQSMNMPIAVNISYGTNDGSHDGNSLFETYINDMAEQWKGVIVVASGNEGNAGHHYSYTLKQNETADVKFSLSTSLKELGINLWKNFADTFTTEIIAPNGTSTGTLQYSAIPKLVHLDGVLLSFVYNQPSHYNQDNSVIFVFKPGKDRTEIVQGVWTIRITGKEIVSGRFDMWLPTVEEVSTKTAFFVSSPETTLTLPSCAEKVISVGGYDSLTGGFAPFSGRGYTRHVNVKPDLTAPAVNVKSCRAGGGYGYFTGTSMAAPFVTGSAALMMQWGIVQGNDPFLYGQRVKAFFKKGAKRDKFLRYPNNMWGYGTLCLKESMDYLIDFSYIKE